MTDEPEAQIRTSNPSREGFLQLLEKKQSVAKQIGSLQGQLYAIDQGLRALKETAQAEVISISLPKGDAGLLMAICVRTAARGLEAGPETCVHIDRIGNHIFNALYSQNEQFARGVREMMGKHDPQGQQTKQPEAPRGPRPYRRYTDDQMKSAWSKSALFSNRHRAVRDHVRLYLNRSMLVEMYLEPKRLRPVYASMLETMDTVHENCANSLCDRSNVGAPPEMNERLRFKPYEKIQEGEMKAGLKRFGISPAQVKSAYGFLAVSLHRESILQLYTRSPQIRPAVACLLRMFDEKHSVSLS